MKSGTKRKKETGNNEEFESLRNVDYNKKAKHGKKASCSDIPLQMPESMLQNYGSQVTFAKKDPPVKPP